jgi:hypothetical protein
MEAVRRTQLVRQRTVAKRMLTRIQNFIEAGDLKLNEIQVRFDEISNILIDTTPPIVNWNYQTTQIILVIENYLKLSTIDLKQGSVNFYILL